MNNKLPEASPDAMIAGITHSVSCFNYGLLSYVPMFGLIFSIRSSVNFFRARKALKGFWNPAQKYLIWGRIFAFTGGIIWAVLIVYFIGCLLTRYDML